MQDKDESLFSKEGKSTWKSCCLNLLLKFLRSQITGIDATATVIATSRIRVNQSVLDDQKQPQN